MYQFIKQVEFNKYQLLIFLLVFIMKINAKFTFMLNNNIGLL